MRAVIQERYGPPEAALRVGEVERPDPGQGEVLVRVHATTVTRGDAMGVRGDVYRFTRLFTGIRRPRRPICGTEFSGVVEEVGAGVAGLQRGEAVFGIRGGSNAEYVVVPVDDAIAPRPHGLDHEQAAAVPEGALLALTCLQPAQPLEGKSVLVYGAAGSIGTAAVQLLAHHFDADVTAVCDTEDVELVRSLGAGEVIDRLSEEFTARETTYDVIFDAVGKHSFRRCRKSLKPRGVFVTVDLGFLYHVPFLALLTRIARRRRASLGIGKYRQADLVLLKGLVEAGSYRPVVDRVYPLDDAIEAVRYVETGQKTGNVVLRVIEERDGHG